MSFFNSFVLFLLGNSGYLAVLQASGSSAGYLAVLLVIWQCWHSWHLSGSGGSYLAVLPAIWQHCQARVFVDNWWWPSNITIGGETCKLCGNPAQQCRGGGEPNPRYWSTGGEYWWSPRLLSSRFYNGCILCICHSIVWGALYNDI